jgi:hypothetical protein
MEPFNPSAIGLRAKTARAIALALGGPASLPLAICRTELILSSREMPATSQPYHEVMELPWDQAQLEVRRTSVFIEKLAAQAIAGFARDVRSRGFAVQRVAIVGAPDRRLESIGNPHIRAHAAEGVLYRHVLEVGAAANSLISRAFVEKGLLECAAASLGLSETAISSHLARLGGDFGRPWRVDEKMAAIAAWLALVDHAPNEPKGTTF